jgi:hypothetical protein
MEQKNLIEFVCTYNNGRSPLAEAFANQYLKELKDDFFKAISSGNKVCSIDSMRSKQRDYSKNGAIWLIKKGLERGLYKENRISYLKNMISDSTLERDTLKLLQPFAYLAGEVFITEEQSYRKKAFKKYDLGEIKSTRTQLIPRLDTAIVIAMGLDNFRDVLEAYENISNTPIMGTLAGYATHNKIKEFSTAYAKNESDYMIMAETIRGYVRASIDRLLEEN